MRLSLFAPLENLIAPPPPRSRVAFLAGHAYAHRGLHGGGTIENSRAAFRAAIAAGHGIELDIQMSSDGQPFVFHDAMLDRLTEEEGPVAAHIGSALSKIRLRGSDETIPHLSEILALVNRRVPILIEVKTGHVPVGATCLAIRRLLEGYGGPFAIMSFNPQISAWLARHAPRIVRGLVVTEDQATGLWARTKGAIAREASLLTAKPEFVAYDVRDLPASSFAAAQRNRGLPVLTWTVRTPDQERDATRHADAMIFETPSGSSA